MAFLGERTFYKLWIQRAFSRALWITGVVNLLVGIGSNFGADKWPSLSWLWTRLRWTVPITIFLSFVVYRLSRSAYEIFHNLDEKREAAEDELREKRRCQAIADMLTNERHYGTHQLLHQPPANEVDFQQWLQWVQNWNEGVFARMREHGCSPQDLDRVITIAMNDLPPHPGNEIAAHLTMHGVRLQRVAEIEQKYARRAEDLMMRCPDKEQ